MSLLEELKKQREQAVALEAKWRSDAVSSAKLADATVVKIADLDKAIAALSTEREGGLLDPQSPSVDDAVRNQAEGEASPDALAKLLEVAFREGAAAYHEGGRVNPYPEPGEMFEAWWNGFYFEEDADGGPAPNAERISDESQAELVIEQTEESDLPALTDQQYQALPKFEDEGTPVLDAEPPSIPRSEIPEGAAVETFTDTGVETVKIGGITRVVEDVADTRQGDAAVFARGILEENSEEPQGRRFGFTPLFGKKELVS